MSNDDKTRIVRPLEQLQRPIAPDPGDKSTTRQIPERADQKKEGAAQSADEGKTQLIRPAQSKPPKATSFDPLGTKSEGQEASDDPVVGWLVIVKGPGRGNAVRLGYGWNSIGRDVSQRVRLDFGDPQISRLNHAKLLYDPRSRRFTLTLGESTNPTYIRGEVVLAPTELKSEDRIQLGNTELMFVALCGTTFDWQESE